MFSTYGEVYRNAKTEEYIVSKRLEMVRFAHSSGYKPAARAYSTDKHTVKLWCRRYALEGIEGLKNKSKRPKNSPRTIPESIKNKIIEATIDANSKSKFITVNNIRRKIKLFKYSDTTINRYINKALKNTKKNPPKYKSNGGYIDFKKGLQPFEIIQVDIKYLTDIDNLKPHFNIDESKSLMKYQITAQDVLTGFPLVAYCPEKALCYTKLFLENVLTPFLKQFRHLDFKTIRIQTDNGTEFTNKYIKTDGNEPKISEFTIFINNKFKEHRTIIPGHCTAQSEVESFHWSIERDCLAWEDITDNPSLVEYVYKYMKMYVHTIIKDRGYSPYQKIKETLHCQKVKVPKPILLSIKEQ